MALVAVGVLALITVSLNVMATRRAYHLGEVIRQTDDLRLLIAHRKADCRVLIRTATLDGCARDELGLTMEDLYPEAAQGLNNSPTVRLEYYETRLASSSKSMGAP